MLCKYMNEWIIALFDLLLPRTCTVCETGLKEYEHSICRECESHLPRTYFWKSEFNGMSEKLNHVLQEKYQAMDFAIRHTPFCKAAALYFYKGGFKSISRSLKYHADFRTGHDAACMLGKKLCTSPLFSDVDLIIPIPLHWMRLLSRGYNQASIIAEGLASEMKGAQVDGKILLRSRRTRSQATLSISEKAGNVHGAFSVNGARLAEVVKMNNIKHILLVDDVFTTGSTMSECILALQLAIQNTIPTSEIRISAACLAFVGD